MLDFNGQSGHNRNGLPPDGLTVLQSSEGGNMSQFVSVQCGKIALYKSRRTGKTYKVQPHITENTDYAWQAETHGLLILSRTRKEILHLIDVADNH